MNKFMLKISILFIFFISGMVCSYADNYNADKLLLDSVLYSPLYLNLIGAKKALEDGANPNALWESNKNISVLSFLSISCTKEKEKECIEIATLLFKHGAKLQNIYGDNTILYSPIANGLLDFTELLLKNGASATKKIDGELPIEIAEENEQTKIIDLLVKYGAKPINKRTAIQLRFIKCASQRNIPCMNGLLDKGANIDGKDSVEMTALISILREPVYEIEQYETVKFLLKNGADPNLNGNSGFYNLEGIPLHIAIAMNRLTLNKPSKGSEKLAQLVIEALLDAGAFVSGRDENWKTPLHVAAEHNNLKGAQLLIKAGAKIMSRDKSGKTPLDFAESADMIKLLKKHGAKE